MKSGGFFPKICYLTPYNWAQRKQRSKELERKQRTEFNHSYNSWEDIHFGVPQGLILDPILFNIFSIDFVFNSLWNRY